MTSWGWAIMLRHNGGCTPWTPEPCLAGWPDAPCAPEFRVFWLFLGGYYAHELLATALRVTSGVQKRDMIVHHSATLGAFVVVVVAVFPLLPRVLFVR